MTFNRNMLSEAVRLGLVAGAFGLFSITAAPVMAQDSDSDSEEIKELEGITVTGSRIKRTEIEGAVPVNVIDRANIDLSGEVSVMDVLQNTTFNSFGSYRPVSGSSAAGFGEVSLRGLGGGRTLLLMDGRRLPKGPQFIGGGMDLNTIPMAAVQNIEVLTDGASAIYGADAIGGVINVITRKDYDGAQLRYGFGLPDWDGGDTEELSGVFGATTDRSSVMFGYSENKRAPIFDRQRPWSQAVIGTGRRSSRSISAYGNNYFDGTNLVAVPGCENIPNMHRMDDEGLVFGAAGSDGCFYNYTAISMQEAKFGTKGIFGSAEFQISDDWKMYSQASATRVDVFGRYAPPPDRLRLPADSPNNTTGSETTLYHRYAALGPRDTSSKSTVTDAVVGFEGMVGDFTVDFGLRRSLYEFRELGRNYLVRTTARQYLADGTYNVFDPFSTPEAVLNSMKATISRDSLFEQRESYITAQHDLFDLGAGASVLLVGLENRDEVYGDKYDSLSEAGQIGGSAGNSSGGSRNVKSAFFEWFAPITSELEMTVAGRYDKYSDFGGNFSPKVSFRYQPMDALTVRASYGQGFAAPALDILTQKETFSAAFATDFRFCQQTGVSAEDCPRLQYDTYSIANADLGPETSEQFSLGLAFQPLDWLNGTLDYYNIKIEDRIAQFGAQTLLNYELAGRAAPPGLGVTRDANGRVTRIDSGFGNQGQIKTDGLDLNLRTSFDFEEYGMLRSNLMYSWINSFEVESLTTGEMEEFIGERGRPRYQMTLGNNWQYGDFNVAWNIRRVGSTEQNDSNDNPGKIDPWTTHDLQGSYKTPWNGTVTLGIRNVAGEAPPLNPAENRNYNLGLYNGYGRVPYIRYTQDF